jgi:CRP-like cAMP-binding protein
MAKARLDYDLLDSIARRRPFFKGRVVGVQGQPCEGVFIIGEGQVLLSRAQQGGDDYALYLLGAGDVFGEGALQPDQLWLVTARGVTDGFAYVISPAAIPRVLEYYPALGTQVLTLLSERLKRAHRRQDLTQFQSAKERVYKLLLLLGEYHGQTAGAETWVPLELTQSEIGEMVGVARETVVRSLGELEQDGLIRKSGRKGLWLRPAPE